MPPLNLLIVHAELPTPDRDAVSVRLLETMRLLVAAGHRITFFGRAGRHLPIAYRRRVEALGIDVHCWDPARLRAAGLATQVADPDLDLDEVFAGFDAAWVVTWKTAEEYVPLLRHHAPECRVIVDTTDVAWTREHRGAVLSGDPRELAAAEETRRRETAAYRAADALIAISAEDAAELGRMAPGVPVHELGLVQDEVEGGLGFADRDGVLFVGNFWHKPNVDAVLWLAREVWPHVIAARPGMRLRLVGTAPPPEVEALDAPGLTVVGWVPELEPELARARVSVAPLRYGGGIKGKIAQALAHGIGVVTTPIGAEGMHLEHEREVLVAEDPVALAAELVRLHDDEVLWNRLTAAGRGWVHEHTSSAAASASLARALPRRIPVALPADDLALQDVLAGYLAAAGDAPVTLQLVVDGDLHAAFARVSDALGALGSDSEAVPDMALVPAGGAVTAGPVPADWTRAVGPVDRGPRVARAVVARLDEDLATALAQVDALAAAGLRPDTRVVLTALGRPERDLAVLRERAAGWADVLASPRPLGARGTIHRAVVHAHADVVAVLRPLALPGHGLEDVLDAGRDALAAPVVAGVAGLTAGADDSLWPRTDGPLDAVPLDVVAAPTELWLGLPFELDARDGLSELQLARHAAAAHGLAPVVVATASAERVATEPVSVIVATRNRVDELPANVALLMAHGLGRDGSELVIVDNGSTDGTTELAAELAAQHPGVVRVVSEPRQGLCHARNAGLAAARHELLLYLDDDARPAPGWSTAIAHELCRPGVVSAGGPIAALWPATGQRPTAGLERLFSVLDLGDRACDVVPPEFVYGANWAARKSAVLAVGGFDPTFGLGPTQRINADETTVAWRLHLQSVGKTRWVPEAAVGHRISADRLDWDWMIDRSYLVGVERARQDLVLHERTRPDMEAQAGSVAVTLLRHIPGLEGDLTPEDVVAQITHLDLDEEPRIKLVDHFGWLVAAVVLLGENQVAAGPLRLHLRPEHADGWRFSPAGARR